MTTLDDVQIDSFFCGPSASANGGYAAGVTAALLGEPARVSLPKPPPVDRPLTVQRIGAGVTLFDGEEAVLVATPRRHLDVQVPQINPASARAAVPSAEIIASHRAPTCVVCGPGRADGFRIFPGPVAPGIVATSWRAPAIGCRPNGEVPAPVLWAAMDCPGGWCFEGVHLEFVPVLVSQSVDILTPIHADEEVVIVAWKTGRADRTLRACTAVLDLEGRPLAVSKQTCVAVPPTWATTSGSSGPLA